MTQQKKDATTRKLLQWREQLGSDYFIVLKVARGSVSWLQLRPSDDSDDDEGGDAGNFFFQASDVDVDGEAAPLPAAGMVRKEKVRKGDSVDYMG